MGGHDGAGLLARFGKVMADGGRVIGIVCEVKQVVEDLQRTHHLVEDDACLAAELGHSLGVFLFGTGAIQLGIVVSFCVQARLSR